MVDERTAYWGERDAARYRTQDDDPTGGDFVVAETLDANGDPVEVLLRWDDTAGEWVSGGPVNMSGGDVTNVGALDADSVSTDEATVGTTPTGRPLTTNAPIDFYLDELPTGSDAEFNTAFAKSIPVFPRHSIDARIPSNDSLKDINIKPPSVVRMDHAEYDSERTPCNLIGSPSTPTDHKVNSIHTAGNAGWAWAFLGCEIQQGNPYSNESAGIGIRFSDYVTVRDIEFADPATTGKTIDNGIVSYASNVEVSRTNLGNNYIDLYGIFTKHGGSAFEQKKDDTALSGSVGVAPYYAAEGPITIMGNSSTATGGNAYAHVNQGYVWDAENDITYRTDTPAKATPGFSEVTVDRGFGQWFQNSSGMEKEIQIMPRTDASGDFAVHLDISSSQSVNGAVRREDVGASSGEIYQLSATVPPDHYYQLRLLTGSAVISKWFESPT